MNTTVANVDRILAGFDEIFAPRIVATMNDWAVKIARLKGEHLWHAHPDTDELFMVIDGSVDISLRDAEGTSTVHLERNDVFVVPQGVEHLPSAPDSAVVFLIERADTLTTGDYMGEIPDHINSTVGIV